MKRITRAIAKVMLMSFLFSILILPAFAGETKEKTKKRELTKKEAVNLLTNISVQMRRMATFLEIYKRKFKKYPATSEEMIGTMLKDNNDNRKMINGIKYKLRSDKKTYVLTFKWNIADITTMSDYPNYYPRYDSTQGRVEFQPGVFELREVKL